jgi:hypothetical protein
MLPETRSIFSKICGIFSKKRGIPVSEDEYAGFSSSTKITLDYTLKEVGQSVTCLTRWVNERNEPGPWSETTSAVIA